MRRWFHHIDCIRHRKGKEILDFNVGRRIPRNSRPQELLIILMFGPLVVAPSRRMLLPPVLALTETVPFSTTRFTGLSFRSQTIGISETRLRETTAPQSKKRCLQTSQNVPDNQADF